MGQPAARITDMHTCPMVTGLVPHVGGPIITGMPTVITCGMLQARVTDKLTCVGPIDVIVKGSMNVLVGGLQAARIGDLTAHGGVIVTGCPTVLIGETPPAGSVPGGGAGGSGLAEMMTTAQGMPGAPTQAKTLKDAAKSGAPFCEVCSK